MTANDAGRPSDLHAITRKRPATIAGIEDHVR
jgi:hypothetical protein